ncbi:hypothetical protein J3R30DRAFT_3709695 [Lentinula aciculospora]|uniref:Uncharacterized protein n=1 Tax=Lentinula aciculospora TaxID=153920 RepID=A0A9W9A2L0_9AGAR|nr:hypothetical protein J3R30DRAFT_3709695 [Lentinula aciculospora]
MSIPSLLAMNSSIFSGPCFGDESPIDSSTADVAPMPSPLELTSNTTQIVEEALAERHLLSTESGPPPMIYGNSIPSSTVEDHLELASTDSVHDQFALSTTEPQSSSEPGSFNIQNHALNSSISILPLLSPVINPRNETHSSGSSTESDHPSPSHMLSIEPASHSEDNALKPNESTVKSPRPQLAPENQPSSFVEDLVDMDGALFNERLQLINLPSSTISPEILVLSLSSPTATNSALENLTVTEEMLLEEHAPDTDHNALRDYPMLESQTIESQQLATTSDAALELSPCSPPPAPRPALLMLPHSESELIFSVPGTLTSVELNLITSLSQGLISRPTSDMPDTYTEQDACDGHHRNAQPHNGFDRSSFDLMLPSSSPDHNILASSPNPPDSSPPKLFSSSPSRSFTTNSMLVVNERRSPPLAFLHRTATNSDTVHRDVLGAVLPPEQLMLSEESEPIPPLLFAQSDNQDTDNFMQLNPLSDDFSFDSSDEPNPACRCIFMVYHITLPDTSSPMPSSSPGEVDIAVASSSPTSSPPVDSLTMAYSSPPRKRKRGHEEEGSRSSPVKRPAYTLPAPKRSTIASQRRQHKKLVTPFKSPLMARGMRVDTQLNVSRDPLAVLVEEASNTVAFEAPPSSKIPSPTESEKKRFSATVRATAQFKSPLSSIGAAHSAPFLGQVRLTPTIQALERKIQILKRALKVNQNNEEVVLSDLTTRWTEAGREVAWEVWELVKDNGDSSNGSGSSVLDGKRSFNESWGWGVQGNEKRIKSEDSWGWSTTDRSQETEEAATLQDEDPKVRMGDEDEERVEYTLGMMLRRLGIDPNTLGWDDEEGIFKDP